MANSVDNECNNKNTESETLSLRNEPKLTGTILANIPNGAVLEVSEIVVGETINGDANWAHIKYDGKEGFCTCTWLIEVPESSRPTVSTTIPSKSTIKYYKVNVNKNEIVKKRTIELYDKLPMTSLEDRQACTEIRDEIIELNYPYFVSLAKKMYVDNPAVTFEDKLQTILYNFCILWPEWRFPKINKYGQYRDYKNLSFAVFFKPRLYETSRRELNVIKYSLRRSLCSKAASMLNKERWSDVTKEDIARLDLPKNELDILERIFNSRYTKDIDKPETGADIKSIQLAIDTVEELYTENYDSVVDLIVHEMIEQESKLSDSHLLKMSNLYTIPYNELLKARPLGEAKLKQQLEDAINLQSVFECDTTDYYEDEEEG